MPAKPPKVIVVRPPERADGMITAKGPGPREFRIGLVVVALVYLFSLLHHGWLPQPFRFFTDATALFPSADHVSMEFRLEAWSCEEHDWRLIDPRPYFPLLADNKESRFQRLAYFYGVRASKPPPGTPAEKRPERVAFQALDDYIERKHPDVDDGLGGAIGGIQVSVFRLPIPPVGSSIDRYDYEPLTVPAGTREDLYHTPESKRKLRCRMDKP